MNSNGGVTTVSALCSILLSIGCGSPGEPVDPQPALRAMETQRQSPPEAEPQVPRVVEAKAGSTVDAVMELEIGKSGSRPFLKSSIPLRVLVPGRNEEGFSYSCSGTNADGLDPAGGLGDYYNSFVCFDCHRTLKSGQGRTLDNRPPRAAGL